jgi:thioredoxin 1
MIFTQENFETEVLKSDVPVLVDVWAEWCGPCRRMIPIVEELAAEYEASGEAKAGKLNCDENEALSSQLNIRSIPTFLIFVGGVEKERITGTRTKAELQDALLQYRQTYGKFFSKFDFVDKTAATCKVRLKQEPYTGVEVEIAKNFVVVQNGSDQEIKFDYNVVSKPEGVNVETLEFTDLVKNIFMAIIEREMQKGPIYVEADQHTQEAGPTA